MMERPLPPNLRVRKEKGTAQKPGARRSKPPVGSSIEAPFFQRVRFFRRVPWGLLRALGGAAVFLFTLTVCAWGLYRYVSTSPRFAIKHIVVEGMAHRSEDEIAKRGEIAQGRNVFTINLEAARAAILSDPWVEQAKLSRKLPGTVRISIVEREAMALVVLGGDVYLAAPGGEIFKRMEPGDPFDLPVITGIPWQEGGPVERGAAVALIHLSEEVIHEYERFGMCKRYALQEVHVTEEGGIDLVIGRGDPVRLALGKTPYRSKIERAARVLSEIERRKGQALLVFLDNDAHPERVVARMR